MYRLIVILSVLAFVSNVAAAQPFVPSMGQRAGEAARGGAEQEARNSMAEIIKKIDELERKVRDAGRANPGSISDIESLKGEVKTIREELERDFSGFNNTRDYGDLVRRLGAADQNLVRAKNDAARRLMATELNWASNVTRDGERALRARKNRQEEIRKFVDGQSTVGNFSAVINNLTGRAVMLGVTDTVVYTDARNRLLSLRDRLINAYNNPETMPEDEEELTAEERIQRMNLNDAIARAGTVDEESELDEIRGALMQLNSACARAAGNDECNSEIERLSGLEQDKRQGFVDNTLDVAPVQAADNRPRANVEGMCICENENEARCRRNDQGNCIVWECRDGFIINDGVCEKCEDFIINFTKRLGIKEVAEEDGLCKDDGSRAEVGTEYVVSGNVRMVVSRFLAEGVCQAAQSFKDGTAPWGDLNECAVIADRIIDLGSSFPELTRSSGWTDAGGGFNYARFGIDAAAAVVLGSVGGFITNRLVKNSQVEKGFENVMCTVGGSPVAGWGDVFMVGPR